MRVGSELSEQFEVENATSLGSVISPVIYNVLVNGIFSRVGKEFGIYHLRMVVPDLCFRPHSKHSGLGG